MQTPCIVQTVAQVPFRTDEILRNLQLHPRADPVPLFVHLLMFARGAPLPHANVIPIQYRLHPSIPQILP